MYSCLSELKDMHNFGSYMLIPYSIYGCKVGYFCCEIIDECVVIRTFLFVTHSDTPEGDKLKEICGLEKDDVGYWKIDRLSTFMNIDAEKYPRLRNLFTRAGCGDLFNLRDDHFHEEKRQAHNLEGLREFIKKGKNEVYMAL